MENREVIIKDIMNTIKQRKEKLNKLSSYEEQERYHRYTGFASEISDSLITTDNL